MNRDAALRKILACLRLARSSNPNEAASAMRQARAMMEKYGLTEDDALASEIRGVEASTGYRGGNVPQSLIRLAIAVAECYRCEPCIGSVPGRTVIQFFGGGADAEIAAYAFTVLQRQLRTAKARHTARVRKRANKERRAEEFARGWVLAIRNLLPNMKPQGELAAVIDHAIKTRFGQTELTAGKAMAKTGRASVDDLHRGYVAGKNAHLHQGVTGDAQRRITQ